MEEKKQKLLRRLTAALIASATLNTLLLAIVCYTLAARPSIKRASSFQDKQFSSLSSLSLSEAALLLKQQSYENLIKQLKNKEIIDSGYSYRDLAVACLYTFHHFDIERAIQGATWQTRTLSLDSKKTITLFCGLTQHHFESILKFIEEEKWPLTTYGLFLQLKGHKEAACPSLKNAFKMTPEFRAIEIFFVRTFPQTLSSDYIVEMVIEGSFASISAFANQQKTHLDHTQQSLQKLLYDYIQNGSSIAAELLLQVDSSFVTKKFSDEEIIVMLKLLTKKTPASEKFALTILHSMRSEKVLKEAAQNLYYFAGEQAPQNFDYQANLQRFAPLSSSNENIKNKTPSLIAALPEKKGVKENIDFLSSEKKWQSYRVQQGDSLWKLAKQKNISIEKIKQINGLKTDVLPQGKTILLP